MTTIENRRILIIDDNPSIQLDFRKILQNGPDKEASLRAKAAELFGEPLEARLQPNFDVDCASQGEEGLEMIVNARNSGRPYAVAFVDIRMPPGMDGIETIERTWANDPDIQFVICSAYSDYTARDILDRLGVSDRLLLLRKPCDSAEILLLATALTQKWNVTQSFHYQATHGTRGYLS